MNSIPIYGYTIVYISFKCWWALDYFVFWNIRNKVTMDIHIYIFCRYMFPFLLGKYLGVELLGYMETLYLTFWGNARLSSKATVSFYISISSLQFVHIFPLPTLVMSCLFYYSHTSACEVVFHWSLDLQFTDDKCVDESLSLAHVFIELSFYYWVVEFFM